MNPNQPYQQQYGQQQQPPPQQPPPGQGPGSFRPFNPAQQGPPSSGGRPMGPPGGMPRGPPSGGIQPPMMGSGPPRPAFGGPPTGPSSGGPPSFGGGGMAPPPGPQFGGAPGPQFGGGAPPPGPQFGGGGAPPHSAGGMPPPQRFASGPPQTGGPPTSAGPPGGYGGPRGPPTFGGVPPPASGPPAMMAPPASAPGGFMPRGPPTGPPGSSGFQPRGPPNGPPVGPPTGPPTSQGLMNQFGQMNMGNAPPPMGSNAPRPAFGMPPGPNPPMGMNGPPPMGMGGSMSGQPPPRGYAPQPSGNYQQHNDMMDPNYANPATAMQQSPIPEELVASQCDARFMRMSVGSIPHSQDHANKSNLMIGVVIRPLAPQEPGEELDVVNFGPTGVVRCRHCRTYVNPFVHWVDNGRRWRCNLCGVSNDVPSSYFCHLGANQQRQDREERPELNHGSVEIIAPSEYMMRPPQPPCYMFVMDVSAPAVASGAVAIAAQTIKAQLDRLPGAPRTRVGIITYDSAIQFYNLKATLKAPQMMVIGDLEELFIPIPDELLVNLSDSRHVIDQLLDSLPSIHQQARSAETALGPAIRVAFKLMSSIGGKMLVFQSSLPTTGQGALKNRENPRMLGTDKEHTLLSPADTFYRSNAIDFCRQQVSVDTFLFSSQYADVATLGSLSKFSAGQLYYYPAFNAERDGEQLKRELAHCLTRETAWEAVMRVRCTKGMRLTNFYGNHFMRGPDLLALPTAHSDASFAIEFGHSDALLSSSTISIQAALLYTNSGGERRIRVHNLCVPVSKLFAEVFRTADVDTLCNLMAKSALEMALKTGLDSARSRLQNQCADIVRAYRTSGAFQGGKQGQGGYQLSLPDSLQLLPLYIMSILKNSTFRGGTDLNADERTFLQYELYNMSVAHSRVFIYPRMFALHNMPPEAGVAMREEDQVVHSDKVVAGKSKVVLPPVLNLSIERLACDGIFLLEDTLTFYLWVGRSVASSLLNSLFGVATMEGVDCKLLQLLAPHDEMSQRVHAILNAIREDRAPYMNLVIMREGDPSEGRFFWKLVEDRASFTGGSYSYSEYLGQITRLSMAGGTGGR